MLLITNKELYKKTIDLTVFSNSLTNLVSFNINIKTMAYISPFYRTQYSSKPSAEELAAYNIAANIQQKELEKAKYNKNTPINDEVYEYVNTRFTRLEENINKIIEYLPNSTYQQYYNQHKPKSLAIELESVPVSIPNPYKDPYYDPNHDKDVFYNTLTQSQRELYDNSHSSPYFNEQRREQRHVRFRTDQQSESSFMVPAEARSGSGSVSGARAEAIARSGSGAATRAPQQMSDSDIDFDEIRDTINLVKI